MHEREGRVPEVRRLNQRVDLAVEMQPPETSSGRGRFGHPPQLAPRLVRETLLTVVADPNRLGSPLHTSASARQAHDRTALAEPRWWPARHSAARQQLTSGRGPLSFREELVLRLFAVANVLKHPRRDHDVHHESGNAFRPTPCVSDAIFGPDCSPPQPVPTVDTWQNGSPSVSAIRASLAPRWIDASRIIASTRAAPRGFS